MKNPNSRNLTRTSPYPRRSHYQRQMRKSGTNWFAKRHSIVDEKYNFMLARWEDWPENIILPEVVDYIQPFNRSPKPSRNPAVIVGLWNLKKNTDLPNKD
jgi:hypothetical protein